VYLGFGIWDLGSWEPKEALLGGVDGFGAYHKIASSLRVHSEIIKPKGFLVLEIGKGQGKKVAECPMSIVYYWELSSHWDLNWVHRNELGKGNLSAMQ